MAIRLVPFQLRPSPETERQRQTLPFPWVNSCLNSRRSWVPVQNRSISPSFSRTSSCAFAFFRSRFVRLWDVWKPWRVETAFGGTESTAAGGPRCAWTTVRNPTAWFGWKSTKTGAMPKRERRARSWHCVLLAIFVAGRKGMRWQRLWDPRKGRGRKNRNEIGKKKTHAIEKHWRTPKGKPEPSPQQYEIWWHSARSMRLETTSWKHRNQRRFSWPLSWQKSGRKRCEIATEVQNELGTEHQANGHGLQKDSEITRRLRATNQRLARDFQEHGMAQDLQDLFDQNGGGYDPESTQRTIT